MSSNTHNPHTLYAKNEKGKYVPVSEYETFDYWAKGTYIVDVLPGCTSIRRRISTTKAIEDVEVIVHRLSNRICEEILRGRNEPRKPKKITPKQKEAYDAWCKAFKTDRVMLKSVQESVENALIVVLEEAKKMREREQSPLF